MGNMNKNNEDKNEKINEKEEINLDNTFDIFQNNNKSPMGIDYSNNQYQLEESENIKIRPEPYCSSYYSMIFEECEEAINNITNSDYPQNFLIRKNYSEPIPYNDMEILSSNESNSIDSDESINIKNEINLNNNIENNNEIDLINSSKKDSIEEKIIIRTPKEFIKFKIKNTENNKNKNNKININEIDDLEIRDQLFKENSNITQAFIIKNDELFEIDLNKEDNIKENTIPCEIKNEENKNKNLFDINSINDNLPNNEEIKNNKESKISFHENNVKNKYNKKSQIKKERKNIKNLFKVEKYEINNTDKNNKINNNKINIQSDNENKIINEKAGNINKIEIQNDTDNLLINEREEKLTENKDNSIFRFEFANNEFDLLDNNKNKNEIKEDITIYKDKYKDNELNILSNDELKEIKNDNLNILIDENEYNKEIASLPGKIYNTNRNVKTKKLINPLIGSGYNYNSIEENINFKEENYVNKRQKNLLKNKRKLKDE